eukprot:5931509-Pleurochrysis_carterae.AAC.1
MCIRDSFSRSGSAGSATFRRTARRLLEAFDLIEATKPDGSFNRAARPVAELAPLPSWQDVDLDAAVAVRQSRTWRAGARADDPVEIMMYRRQWEDTMIDEAPLSWVHEVVGSMYVRRLLSLIRYYA